MTVRGLLLDRDGVLTPDLDRFTPPGELHPLPGVREALSALREAGWRLAVVTNQPWVARGVCGLSDVDAVHAALGLPVDRWYVCPHHPRALVERWRVDCDCRKPRPGMLLRAAADLGLDLSASYLIGDRVTDLEAGARAGCRTIHVRGDGPEPPRIQTPDPPVPVRPALVVPSLAAAVDWLLGRG